MSRNILILLALCALSTSAKPKLVIVATETEYKTPITIPAICEQNLSNLFDIERVTADPENRHQLRNADAIASADVLVLSLWRSALPTAQLAMIRQHIAAGKSVVGLRTASHGFALRANMPKPDGHDTWDTFDADVFGGNYNGHGPSSQGTSVSLHKASKKHPILDSVKAFKARSWLYHVKPLAEDCHVLLNGDSDGETHPAAWTRTLKSGSRVFYTSLGGHWEFVSEASMRNLLVSGICWAADIKAPRGDAGYETVAEFAEPDFPFLTSIIDAGAKGDFPSENLTVRGVIIKLSPEVSACFDTDLCRLAAVWRGGLIDSKTMAPNSYSTATAFKKAPGGFGPIPTIVGKPISALGVYPGFGQEAVDPRSQEPFPRQPGRGPIPTNMGRWGGIQLSAAGPILSYSIKGREIREMLLASATGYVRHFEAGAGAAVTIKLTVEGPHCSAIGGGKIHAADGLMLLTIDAGEATCSVAIGGGQPSARPFPPADVASPARWPQVQETRSLDSALAGGIYQARDIELPHPNPWSRNVRVSGIDFFADGRAAIVTYDGDVWLVDGLDKKLRKVSWKRFASGLYEPLNLCVVAGKIYVFHRNEITRLHDYNADGTADFYENFCNLPVQSPESREFALDIVKRPGGGFYIVKGGQQSKERGIHGGCVLSVSADGKSADLIATRTREAYLGIHPKTGTLFGTDQQGHYIPATPIYAIEKGDQYGFALIPRGETPLPDYEPTPPVMWIPHRVLQSGAHLLWPTDKRLGPISDRLLCLDYYNPGIGVVFCDPNDRSKGGAAYRMNIPAKSGLQHAAINPKDGNLYIAGFKIWGSKAEAVSSLTRLELAKGPDSLPRAIEAYQEGVRIALPSAIDPAAIDIAEFTAERWNYLRSKSYGSPHFTLSGEKGQDEMFVQSLTLSKDKKSLFIRIADMRPVMQMQVDYAVTLTNGLQSTRSVYLTPRKLAAFQPQNHGFGKLAPARKATVANFANAPAPSAKLGALVAEKFGCIACHSSDGSTDGRIGPTWKGIHGSRVALAGGETVTADAAFIRESILEPRAKVRLGFDRPDAGMPSYAGVLKPHELESVLLYIQTLK